MPTAPRKRRNLQSCQNCPKGATTPGKYELIYENNIPIFVCNVCGHRREEWKSFYETYLTLYKTKENWNERKNWVSCVLGAFCFFYKKSYNISYTFVPKSANPFSSKECKDVWTLIAAFAEDIHEVRRYVRWIFENKITNSTNLTSFGYLLSAPLIRKYKLSAIKKNTLTRASPLPFVFLQWCQINTPEIFDNYTLNTMNDLGALLSQYKAYFFEKECIERQVITQAETLGLTKGYNLNVE